MVINRVLLQWFYAPSNTSVSLPVAYENDYRISATPGAEVNGGTVSYGYGAIWNVTLTGFFLSHLNQYPNQHVITIGY